jgi:sialidase-1
MRSLVALLSFIVAAAPILLGAVPFIEKSDLFREGERGFSLYRIPGIVVTKTGSVLAYCEARRDSEADWGEIEIHLRRSTDGGHTWEAARQIAHLGARLGRNPVALAHNAGGAEDQTVNNPVAIVDSVTGTVHFLYCVEYMRCFYFHSEDDGVTWTEPAEITATFDRFRPEYDWKVIATGPGHGIQLRTGRLVVPVWISGARSHPHGPAVATTIYSDDHGKTWHPGEIAVPEKFGPSETAAVELSDGRVMLNVRNRDDAGRRLVVVSGDGATGWSTPKFDDVLTEPICMAGMTNWLASDTTLSARILFSNPASESRARRNLTIRLSEDDGRTWSASRSIEPGPSAYSDLAVLPDGTILCFYERGLNPSTARPYGALTLARFNIEWLTSAR